VRFVRSGNTGLMSGGVWTLAPPLGGRSASRNTLASAGPETWGGSKWAGL